mmetsp:Transcript_24315/g.61971  ORF Transcript_24315/g.61971 Transcript_24315/m.61971 type:complete len:201 (-) Transcript_24315:29-631(-)
MLVVVLNPAPEISQSQQLIQLVRAAHAQGQKTVQVVRVHFVALPQAGDRLDVLVQLRIELAELAPAFGAFGILPHLSLQAQQRLAVPAFAQQPHCLGEWVVHVEIWILVLELVLGTPVRGRPHALHVGIVAHPRLVHNIRLREVPCVLHRAVAGGLPEDLVELRLARARCRRLPQLLHLRVPLKGLVHGGVRPSRVHAGR